MMKHTGLSRREKVIPTLRLKRQVEGKTDRSVTVEGSCGLGCRELAIDFLRTSKANQDNKESDLAFFLPLLSQS